VSINRNNPKYITSLSQISSLSPERRRELSVVAQKFAFRTNEYYQSLIDWNDPADPIRRIVMPEIEELDQFGAWDASHEASYTVVKGLEHKYSDTGLLLVNNVCGAYCRFCFRKRLFTDDNDEVTNDIGPALDYIRAHPEINNVLLSGGDPLIMSTGKLENIIQQVRRIDHVKVIRIGSKMPALNPLRIVNDPSLSEMLSKYSQVGRKIFVMAHFNHPRELTDVAVECIAMLQRAGLTVVNQTPIIRGVNDDPTVLAELFNCLSFNGVPPYYVFICRPTAGNRGFVVPIEEALAILDGARENVSGLARQARLCMSHKSGKIEVLGRTDSHVILRYHRAANPADTGKVLVLPSKPTACWFDDYFEHTPELELGELAARSAAT